MKEKEKKEKWKNKIKKPKDVKHFLFQISKSHNFDLCARPSQNVVKRTSIDKKSKLSCCKCLFDSIETNLANLQPENPQNVQKLRFWQKAPGVNGLISGSYCLIVRVRVVLKRTVVGD